MIALAIYGGFDLARSVLAQEDYRAYVPYTQQPGSLEDRVAALEYELANVVASSDAITLAGSNLYEVNGTGTTHGEPNGLGNLIVGYAEERLWTEVNNRGGSHMLVVGKENNYASFGGIVVGEHNSTSGPWASVSGGLDNEASGANPAV